jgi:hypothetical protein
MSASNLCNYSHYRSLRAAKFFTLLCKHLMLSYVTVHTQSSFCFDVLWGQPYDSHSDLKSIIVYIKPYGQWLSLCMIQSVWGTGVTAPCFLKLSTRWGWVVSFLPQLLCSWWKSCQYPLNSRLGGFVSLDVLKKGNDFCLCMELNHNISVVQPVA